MDKKLKTFLLIVFFLIFSIRISAEEIHDVVIQGDLQKVIELIKKNPELLNSKDQLGRTPLHWATRGVHLEIIKYLVSKGAEINCKDNMNVIPLHSIAVRGHTEAAKFLILHGADINAIDKTNNTSLSYALSRNFKEIVSILIENKVKIPTIGQYSKDLLHRAASSGYSNLVELMIKKGVDISTLNSNGGILLHSAASGGVLVALEFMLKKGYKVDGKNRYFLTPLHLAVINQKENAVGFLVKNSADINLPTRSGKTPLGLAIESGNKNIIAFLEKKGASKTGKFEKLKGDYLGQQYPGFKPLIFSPGIITSINWDHGVPVFSKDGKEVYWSFATYKGLEGCIQYMKKIKNIWTAPEIAPFSKLKYRDENPFLSDDGSKLYFTSLRPIKKGEKIGKFNIWYVERIGKKWSEAKPIEGPKINTGNDGRPLVAKNGNLYFASWRKGGMGSSPYPCDIYISKFNAGKYSEPVNLGGNVNSEYMETCSYIAPDESFLIFESDRPGGYGSWDLYISFKKDSENWSKPINLGDKINSSSGETFATLSPDHKYFFFISNRNGNDDVYWIDSRLIFKLNK